MGAERRRSGRRITIGGTFAPRLIEMLESPAYRALSLSAHRVLARIEIELAHHGGTENGALPVTFEDFHRYGIHRHSIGPAIRQCVALGFITTKPGVAGNAEFRRPSLFGLTYRHTNYADPSDDWRKVATAADAERLARTAARRPQKQNPSAGKCRLSVPVSGTETGKSPVMDSVTTGPVMDSVTTSISRGGGSTSPRTNGSPEPRAGHTSARATGGTTARSRT